MILDHPNISRRTFFPRPTDVEPSLRVDVGDVSLGCYLRRPYSGAGLLLHFHGNGELASDYDRVYAKLFLQMGVNVCFAEYRGYGRSNGSASLVAMLGDGERIVHTLGIEPERLVVLGRSLGSLYAFELVRRIPQVAGLIIDSGIADVSEFLKAKSWPPEERAALGLSDAELTVEERSQAMQFLAQQSLALEVSSYFDHRAKLQGYDGKILVLHTENDQVLPPSHGERLYAWAGGSDKRLIVFPEGDHNTIFSANRARYLRELEDFFRRAGL